MEQASGKQPSALTLAVVAGSVLATALMFVNALTGSSDLRNGLVPVSAGLLALSSAGAVFSAGQHGLGIPRHLATVCATVTALALVGVSGFFFSLSAFSLVDSDLLSGDTAAAGLGTLVASLLTFVIVPAGLLLLGAMFIRDHRLPLGVQIGPWLFLAALVGGAALLAGVPEERELWLEFMWFALLAGLVAYYALALPSEGSTSTRPVTA